MDISKSGIQVCGIQIPPLLNVPSKFPDFGFWITTLGYNDMFHKWITSLNILWIFFRIDGYLRWGQESTLKCHDQDWLVVTTRIVVQNVQRIYSFAISAVNVKDKSIRHLVPVPGMTSLLCFLKAKLSLPYKKYPCIPVLTGSVRRSSKIRNHA